MVLKNMHYWRDWADYRQQGEACNQALTNEAVEVIELPEQADIEARAIHEAT